MPTEPVEGIVDAPQYASSIPWFPADAAYNMIWPNDFTKDELAYVNSHYPDDDPIRQPFTIVRRANASQAAVLRTKPWKNSAGEQVEWLREGPEGKRYHVLNMAFDTEMRPHFERLASALRAQADTAVKGSTLHPQFKAYTLTMAQSLEEGDFIGMLQADLRQSEGGLFMTMFPHEGYWNDGVKYPFLAEIGIRDTSLLGGIRKNGYLFHWMGKEVEAVARKAGLQSYTAPAFDVSNIQRDAAFIWPIVTGAFMRAYVRDPGGHDYPKRKYDGCGTHRVVMLLDTLKTWAPLTKQTVRNIFGQDIARHVSFAGFASGTLMHEAGHGSQIPQTEVVGNGKPFNEAFNAYWGVLVEPWSDLDAVLGAKKLLDDRKFTQAEFERNLYSMLGYQFVRLRPRAAALSKGMMAEGPHITGSSLTIAWLWQKGAVYRDDKGRYQFRTARLMPAMRALRDELVTFAARGDQTGYAAFLEKTVQAFPETVEQELIVKRGAPSYTLINRGFLKVPTKAQLR